MARHTRTGYKPAPAILRSVSDEDGETRLPRVNGSKKPSESDKIMSQPKDTVTHNRGFGDSGYRTQIVEHDCPQCEFDRMIRRIDVSPERQDEVRYWCLNPNCVHFVSDHLSHDCHGSYPQNDTNEPTVYESGP